MVGISICETNKLKASGFMLFCVVKVVYGAALYLGLCFSCEMFALVYAMMSAV